MKDEQVDLMQKQEIVQQKMEQNIFLDRKDCCYDRSILNIFLLIGLVTSIVLYFILHIYDQYYIFIPIGIFGIGYLIEVLTSNTLSFLCNSMKYNLAEQKITLLTNTLPIIRWIIQNYHYETRTRRVSRKTKNGTSYHTEHYTVRVNTHAANENVAYQGCVDSSNMMECLKHLPLLQYCRLYVDKFYNFSDQSSQINYETRKSTFIRMNHTDTHYDFSETYDIPGFLSRICTYGSSDNSMPCMYSVGMFLLFSLIGFGWVIRILLYKNSFAAKANIIKVIKF